MKKIKAAALCAFTVSAMSALPLQTIGATVRMATETFVINKVSEATAGMATEIFVTNKVSEVSNYVDKVVDEATAGMATEIFVTNKVSEVSNYVDKVVDEATAGMATEIFVTNKVSVVSNYVNTVKAEMEERTPVKRIAMFIVPVNHEKNGSFTGFELKASTNNFSYGDAQFYSQSEVADKGADYGNDWDKMKMYVGTGYGSWDVRAYTKIGNTIDWEYELRNVVVLVDASCIVKHPGDWLREDNEDLMWCYLRNMNNDSEREEGSTKTLWHPIAPVRWFSKLPNWALQ